MELRILGPVELVVAGRTVYLARRQQRLILGILAMEANRLVPLERLINLVWNGSPPRRARAVLHTRVSEIRATLHRHLGDRRFLATRDGGYLLNIAPEKVDLHRFRRLLRDARQAESDVDARRLLRTANDLWRGPVLEGWPATASHGSLHADIEQARLAANEDLWELELKLGNHLLVVEEITQAVTRNPDRERLVGLAMTALHRSGRTAAALRQFEHNRHWLAAEMGVDPSAQLRELYLAMLTGNTATDPRKRSRPAGFVPAVPQLLPSLPADFTGRENEATRTRSLLTAESRSVRLAVVTGPAGVGKTIHWP